jgi:hypothetical protein
LLRLLRRGQLLAVPGREGRTATEFGDGGGGQQALAQRHAGQGGVEHGLQAGLRGGHHLVALVAHGVGGLARAQRHQGVDQVVGEVHGLPS